jgi:hypothetical protein
MPNGGPNSVMLRNQKISLFSGQIRNQPSGLPEYAGEKSHVRESPVPATDLLSLPFTRRGLVTS